MQRPARLPLSHTILSRIVSRIPKQKSRFCFKTTPALHNWWNIGQRFVKIFTKEPTSNRMRAKDWSGNGCFREPTDVCSCLISVQSFVSLSLSLPGQPFYLSLDSLFGYLWDWAQSDAIKARHWMTVDGEWSHRKKNGRPSDNEIEREREREREDSISGSKQS